MGRPFAYPDALAALSSALTFGVNPSLASITAMAEAMGRPHDTFASVQVTGTNGKSSTARMTAAILRAHGLRSGLFTSPELHSYTERIEVDGVPVTEAAFASAIAAALDSAVRAGVEPTEFEILTAAALWLFRESAVDVAVLEVGMGGRWDATSVVAPAVAVITGVGLDHTQYLGDTREAIAWDKAHIIKPAGAPILGPGTAGVDAIFQQRAEGFAAHARAVREAGAHSPVAEALTVRYQVTAIPAAPDGATELDVRGVHGEYPALALSAPAYQAGNVATAIAAAEAALGHELGLGLTRAALTAVTLPGRFEVVARDPWLVVDCAHNPQAAAVLANAVRDAWPEPATRPTIVLGVLADKDAEGIVAALLPVAAGFVCASPDSPRALDAAALGEIVERVTGREPRVAESVAAAITLAREGSGESCAVLATGSIRTAAEARIAEGWRRA